MNLGRSIVNIKGSKFRISKLRCTSFLSVCFILANSADPVEMPLFVAFLQGLHCFPKFPVYMKTIVLKIDNLNYEHFFVVHA